MLVDDLVLDDVDLLTSAPRLAAIAGAGASVRIAGRRLQESPSVLGRIAADGRPRAILVLGESGPVMAAFARSVLGRGCPVPVIGARGPLPGWVGAFDLVVVPGGADDPLTESALIAAWDRGIRAVTLVLPEAPGGLALGLDDEPWAIRLGLLTVLASLGLLVVPPAETVAEQLDASAVSLGPVVALLDNPAKSNGLRIAESLPVFISADVQTALDEVLADGCAAAGIPSLHGLNRPAALALVGAAEATGDVFRDRIEDPDGEGALLMVLLGGGWSELEDLARARGVSVQVVPAVATEPVSRVLEVLAPLDWAIAYAAIARRGG